MRARKGRRDPYLYCNWVRSDLSVPCCRSCCVDFASKYFCGAAYGADQCQFCRPMTSKTQFRCCRHSDIHRAAPAWSRNPPQSHPTTQRLADNLGAKFTNRACIEAAMLHADSSGPPGHMITPQSSSIACIPGPMSRGREEKRNSFDWPREQTFGAISSSFNSRFQAQPLLAGQRSQWLAIDSALQQACG
jgi:hypothetical protein